MRKIKNILCNAKVFWGFSITLSTILLGNVYLNSVYATPLSQTTTATTTIRVKSTCSMTATIAPGKQHAATMINGQYLADIGLTTIQTFCNDPSGYVIYAIGYTGGDAGITGGYNTVLRSSTLGSTYDIPTNTYESGDTSGWAMKLASVPGTYEPTIASTVEEVGGVETTYPFTSYHTVPSTYTKVASYPTATDLDNPASTRLGSNLTTTYAAYIKLTQPAGTYEGQVKYVLLHPSDHAAPAGNYKMQDVEDWGGTIAIGQEVTAYDDRDNKAYTVRRMCMSGTTGDSGCSMNSSMLWMTQNLDLDLNKNTELTSEDTDLNVVDSKAYSNGYIQDSLGIIHWTPKNSTITSIDTSTGKFNGWENDNNVAYSADPDAGNPDNPWYATGEAYNSNLCYVGSNSQTCNYLNSNNTVAPTYFSHTAFTTNGNHGKIGNYYNWSAAIASNNSSGYTTNTRYDVANNPQNSICPKGWRLPITSAVAAKNEFAGLNNVYSSGSTSNGTGLINSPVYMVRSGDVSGGALSSAGYNGYYWSSTVSNANYAYSLLFRSDYVIPADYAHYKFFGRSVRCVSDY
ncbi:hypothetical protein IKF02_00565 [Candidatus Saccharibacteria bacterium]|nr:hypothetical protein [Candidatus Saccharibacteria bacterium]